MCQTEKMHVIIQLRLLIVIFEVTAKSKCYPSLFLIWAMAFPGFKCLGHTLVQFMIV